MKKYVLEINKKEYNAEIKEITAEYANIEVDGNLYHVKLKELGRKKGAVSVPVIETAKPAAPSRPAPSAPPAAPKPRSTSTGNAGAVFAPLPGLILEVMVKEGDTVKAGQNIMVMEAMKMENQVQAPHDGTVSKVVVQKGDSVAEGDLLADISRSFISTL